MNHFVGCRTVELIDSDTAIQFPMVILYPSNISEKPEKLGPYDMSLSINAPVKEGIYPLVMISHGTGGSPLVYRTLAHYLASHGFIVGLPEHPFNNRNDNSLENTIDNLKNRPKHLKIAIDWFFSHEEFKQHLKPNALTVIGHSMGGYTALALAGGKPTSFARESIDGNEHEIDVVSDSRIKALVLLAPATVWFRYPGALDNVTAPILMITAEKDEYTNDFHSQVVRHGIPATTQIQHKIINNAGHFSFISLFPEKMTTPAFPPSQDPPGFDRKEFLEVLNREILGFLLSIPY